MIALPAAWLGGRAAVHALLIGAAAQVAWLVAARSVHGRGEAMRLALAFGLAAVACHVGWALLYASSPAVPWIGVLRAPGGFCALFAPIGLLATLPGAGRLSASALRGLVAGLAIARLGCLVGGCCAGVEAIWGGRHPIPLYEGLLELASLRAVRGLPDPTAKAALLVGLGAKRFVTEPLRAWPPLGEPALSPLWIAATLVGLGLVLLVGPGLRRLRA